MTERLTLERLRELRELSQEADGEWADAIQSEIRELRASAPTFSIQLRTTYSAGKWRGYGYVALVAHLDREPKWVPIRDTRTTRVIYRSGKLYAGEMTRSQLALELIDYETEYGDIIAGTF